MKINLEEIVINNIKRVRVFTTFLEGNNLELNIKLDLINNDDFHLKVHESYNRYLKEKYNSDSFKAIGHYIKLFLKYNKACRYTSDTSIKNGYKFDNINIHFSNNNQLSINVPVSYHNEMKYNIAKILESVKYKYIHEKVEYDIYDYLFYYYTYLNIKNIIVFDSDNLFVDIHSRKNIKNSDSIYVFTNNKFSNDILNMILDDFIRNNIENINGINLNEKRIKCKFNETSLECATNLDIVKDKLDNLENSYLDKNIKKLELK